MIWGTHILGNPEKWDSDVYTSLLIQKVVEHCSEASNKSVVEASKTAVSGWWFQTDIIFHNIWDNPSH
jgi:hypothetical protein